MLAGIVSVESGTAQVPPTVPSGWIMPVMAPLAIAQANDAAPFCAPEASAKGIA